MNSVRFAHPDLVGLERGSGLTVLAVPPSARPSLIAQGAGRFLDGKIRNYHKSQSFGGAGLEEKGDFLWIKASLEMMNTA